MRKLITFILVLTVQLSIIYGLYRWYTSDKKTVPPEPQTEQSSVVKQKEKNNQTVNKTSESIKNTTDNVSNKTTESENSKNKTETVDTSQPASATIVQTQNSTSKPLNYKYTEWGNIPALPDSRLASTGILVNINTRKVLWAKNCRKSVPIASMSKMMTALLAFEAIKNDPSVNLDTNIKVTKEAYEIGGSQVWLDPRESFTLKELLKTIMIKSANDSAYLVAQYLGNGNVENFIAQMNKKAKEIGMPNAHFTNPDGLPEKNPSNDNRATAEGLVFLTEHLREFQLADQWAKTKIAWFREGSKNPTMLVNTNHLIRNSVNGVNGMKTGFTDNSGFCITATCIRSEVNMIAVVTGFKTRKARDSFVTHLLDWGYKENAKTSEQ